MSTNASPLSLRGLLLVDALTCAAMGAILLAGASLVAGLTAIPSPVLFWAGLSLLPVAAFMAAVARRAPVPAWGAWIVVLGNIGWVAASLAVLGIVAPNALGTTFILAQTAVVAILAWLEFAALRGSRTMLPAM